MVNYNLVSLVVLANLHAITGLPRAAGVQKRGEILDVTTNSQHKAVRIQLSKFERVLQTLPNLRGLRRLLEPLLVCQVLSRLILGITRIRRRMPLARAIKRISANRVLSPPFQS